MTQFALSQTILFKLIQRHDLFTSRCDLSVSQGFIWYVPVNVIPVIVQRKLRKREDRHLALRALPLGKHIARSNQQRFRIAIEYA